MYYEIFQHRQLPARKVLSAPVQANRRPESFTSSEKTILYFFGAVITGLLTISGWSAVLVVTGNTESGGPIGLLARLLFRVNWS